MQGHHPLWQQIRIEKHLSCSTQFSCWILHILHGRFQHVHTGRSGHCRMTRLQMERPSRPDSTAADVHPGRSLLYICKDVPVPPFWITSQLFVKHQTIKNTMKQPRQTPLWSLLGGRRSSSPGHTRGEWNPSSTLPSASQTS